MYKEYKKVKKFFGTANDLLHSAMTLQDIYLAAVAPKHRRHKAITFINNDGKVESIKYKTYKSKTFELASKLDQKLDKLPKNSIVALKLKNCPKWPYFFWAILMNGHIPFLIDAKLPKENTQHLLEQSKASAIVTQENFSYKELTINVEKIEELHVNYRFAEIWANHVIFCSSGTTGNVKLMMFNGRSLCNQVAAALDMPETTGDIMHKGEINILAFIPLHHIFGFVAVFLWYTFFGKNIVFLKDQSTKTIMETCQRCEITHVYSVPLFWDAIAQNVLRKAELESPKKAEIISKMIAYNTHRISDKAAGIASSNAAAHAVKDALLGRKVEFCISGGGYLSQETLNTINGLGYPLYNGFGMTEVGVTSVELSPRVEFRLKGSIGRPLHGVEYKLVNTSKLHPNVGELCIKSPITHTVEIIDGVEQLPELDDGWLHTGDIASVDANGFYYIKGRIKDTIINENGENIYPDEIEAYFKDLPHVTNLCVVGVKKGRSTHEAITAVLEIANDTDDEGISEIKAKCKEINDTLPNEKKVVDFLISKDKLPLTASMKVKRLSVKDMIKHDIKKFASFDKKQVKSFDGYTKEEVEPVVTKLRSIFAKTLLLPVISIEDDSHWINDLGGDSMSFVELITEVNAAFGIEVPEEKYTSLATVNDFALLILEMKKAKK